MKQSAAQRPGYRGVAADEIQEAGDHDLVVGIHWIRDDGSQGEPFVFQHLKLGEDHIVRIQDYRDKQRALRAART